MFIGDEWVTVHIIDMPFYTKLLEATKGQVTVTELCNVRYDSKIVTDESATQL